MALEVSEQKQQVYELMDRLSAEQLSAIISLLQFMLLDPVSRALASAPPDDEPEARRKELIRGLRGLHGFGSYCLLPTPNPDPESA